MATAAATPAWWELGGEYETVNDHQPRSTTTITVHSVAQQRVPNHITDVLIVQVLRLVPVAPGIEQQVPGLRDVHKTPAHRTRRYHKAQATRPCHAMLQGGRREGV